METSILQQLKKRAGNIIEPSFLKTGTVLEVRPWEPATILEIDLHLPDADMEHWTEVPYIKFRVNGLTFRDYTPTRWDAETHTCTILIDARHNGPGTAWAWGLGKNDTVRYLKIDTTRHAPDPNNLVVGLGDESSIGHLLALQQMTLPQTRFDGAVLMGDAQHREQFKSFFKSPIHPIAVKGEGYQHLFSWVKEQGYCRQHTVFYLTGNHTLVGRLRRALKDEGFFSGQINAKGFWS